MRYIIINEIKWVLLIRSTSIALSVLIITEYTVHEWINERINE